MASLHTNTGSGKPHPLLFPVWRRSPWLLSVCTLPTISSVPANKGGILVAVVVSTLQYDPPHAPQNNNSNNKKAATTKATILRPDICLCKPHCIQRLTQREGLLLQRHQRACFSSNRAEADRFYRFTLAAVAAGGRCNNAVLTLAQVAACQPGITTF